MASTTTEASRIMTTSSNPRKSPVVIVPFVCLIYLTLVLLNVMISTGFAPFSLIFLPFMALFLLSAYGVWRRSRIGYVLSTALSALFLVLEGTQIVSAIGAVTIPNEFLSVITAVPVLVAVFVFLNPGVGAVLGKGKPQTAPPHEAGFTVGNPLVIW